MIDTQSDTQAFWCWDEKRKMIFIVEKKLEQKNFKDATNSKKVWTHTNHKKHTLSHKITQTFLYWPWSIVGCTKEMLSLSHQECGKSKSNTHKELNFFWVGKNNRSRRASNWISRVGTRIYMKTQKSRNYGIKWRPKTLRRERGTKNEKIVVGLELFG